MNHEEVQILNETGTFRRLSINGTVEETHISWVIVGKSDVFKIKKPLKLSFLDFSSLAKRKKYCERELHLNRRFSPIYLNVLPVRKLNEVWSIGEDRGEVVDYVVHMKRLISAKRMDKLLKANRVNANHILSLADVISNFHAGAKKIRNSFRLEETRDDFNDIASISSLAKKYLGTEASAVITNSMRWSDAFLKVHSGRMSERIENGFCRDVHGDLHSGNIFLYKTPILFDCIEFNDAYRQIDVINEIAFFCMDLEFFGRNDLSKLFIKEYQRRLSCFQNEADQRLMTYYKCYRANVRAKVHALSADQASGEKETFKSHLNAWRKYIRLMKSYMK